MKGLRTIRTDIKALQDLKNGAIITLGEHQVFYETAKSYEIWNTTDEDFGKVISISKKRIGFVFQY